MRYNIVENCHILTLSRTNIESLLTKLDAVKNGSTSHCTIVKVCEDLKVVVHAEEDPEHYNGVERGIMVPWTEEAIRQLREKPLTALILRSRQESG